jgi:hypothetical protein
MIDEYGKFDGENSIVFMPEQAEALAKEYKHNQPVRCKVTRSGKAIGKVLEQSNLLHACFKLVAGNSDRPELSTPAAVKMSCKIGIDFRDPRYCFVRPDGGVQLAYRSFKMTGPDALKGKERDEVVQKAFNWLADTFGVTVDRLVEIAKSEMLSKNF